MSCVPCHSCGSHVSSYPCYHCGAPEPSVANAVRDRLAKMVRPLPVRAQLLATTMFTEARR